MNVSEQTIAAIKECNTKCFYLNRYFDTACDKLAIDFVCNHAEGLIHEYMAHAFPALADELNHKCLGAFNIRTYYGETPGGDWDWENLQDLTGGLMTETIALQNMLMGSIDIANENKDFLITAELYDLLRKVNHIVEQAILINDKAILYGDNYASFDHDIDSFFFLDKEVE